MAKYITSSHGMKYMSLQALSGFNPGSEKRMCGQFSSLILKWEALHVRWEHAKLRVLEEGGGRN